VSQPRLDFEERHRLSLIEELRGDGAASPVTGDAATDIVVWKTRLGA